MQSSVIPNCTFVFGMTRGANIVLSSILYLGFLSLHIIDNMNNVKIRSVEAPFKGVNVLNRDFRWMLHSRRQLISVLEKLPFHEFSEIVNQELLLMGGEFVKR
jgi:hypothetical protein